MSFQRKTIIGTTLIFVFSILAAGLGYIVRMIMTRSLSPADYGLFYAIFAMFTLATIFSKLGLNEALTKLIPDFLVEKDYSAIKGMALIVLFFQLLVTGVFSLVIIFFADKLAVSYFKSATAVVPIIILAIVFWLRPLGIIFGDIFMGFQKLNYFAIFDMLKMTLVLIFVGVFFFFYPGSIIAPSLAYLVSFFLLPFLLFPLFTRTFPNFFTTKMVMTKDIFKRVFSFGVTVMVSMVGVFILVHTDTLILTYYRSLTEVGFYQAAYPTANLLFYLPSAISSVILPLSSELWAKREKMKLRAGIHMIYKYSTIIIIPMTFLAVSFPEVILSILFGARYAEAAMPFMILSIGAIFYSIAAVNSSTLSGIGKPGIPALIVLFAAAVNVGLNFIIIPIYGMVGASLTTVLGYIIIFSFTHLKMREHIHISLSWKTLGRYCLTTSLFILIIHLLKATLPFEALAQFVLIVPTSVIFYICIIFLLKIVTVDDVILLKNIVFTREPKSSVE